MSNKFHLNIARKRKQNSFFTLMPDIEEELKYYKRKFKNKTIYCNCDTTESNFYKYFVEHFEELELKCLIITGIQSDWRDFAGEENIIGLKYFGKNKEIEVIRENQDVELNSAICRKELCFEHI